MKRLRQLGEHRDWDTLAQGRWLSSKHTSTEGQLVGVTCLLWLEDDAARERERGFRDCMINIGLGTGMTLIFQKVPSINILFWPSTDTGNHLLRWTNNVTINKEGLQFIIDKNRDFKFES